MSQTQTITISHATTPERNPATALIDPRREWRRRIDRALLNLRDLGDGRRIT
jgi:hypothetical protein